MACKKKTEVYSRVVGFYRPVQGWNKGKQAEFEQRTAYDLSGTAKDTDKSRKLRKTMANLNSADGPKGA